MTPEESAQFIYQNLGDALGQDNERRKKAEQALRAAEESEDFFASLASIATAPDAEAEPNIRWLAAVCAKNAITRSWRRKVRPNRVTEDERDFVRDALLSALGEPTSTIATQLSVWISSVARVDFPANWPDVISELIKRIKHPQSNVMLHALTTLDMVLKQLASRRLISDRKALYRQGPNTFALLYDLFLSRLHVLKQAQASNEASAEAFQVAVRCLKSFRRLISYACEDPSHIAQVPQLFTTIVENPALFLNGAAGGTDVQRRLSLLTAKLIRVAQERHPIAFQPYLTSFLQHSFDTLRGFDSETSDDRVCYHIATFMRNVFVCTDYGINDSTLSSSFQESVDKGEGSLPQGNSAESCRFIVLKFFNESVTRDLVEAIIGKVFVLNQTELETWASDPETLVREEEAAEWGTASLRHECEELFKRLLLRNKRTVVPMVLSLTEAVRTDKPLLLDACFRAVGRAVYDVQGAFDIDAWLANHLMAILAADSSADLGARIVQARVVWLVAQYAEQLGRESRVAVYPQFVRLMSSGAHDRVIALTAAKGLRHLVEDLGFVDTDFGAYLKMCLVACFELIGASESYEMKRELLGTVACLVCNCRARIVGEVIDVLTSYLPKVWEDSPADTSVSFPASRDHNPPSAGDKGLSDGAENLLRTQIITLLKTTVSKVGTPVLQSEAFCGVLYPVLEFSVDATPGKGGIYLMEDGCDLWCAVVAASVEYSDRLRSLFPRILGILDADYTCLQRVFSLVQSYALLGGNDFIQQHGQLVLRVVADAVDSVGDRGSFAAAEALDLLLRLFPVETVRAVAPLLRRMAERALSRNESHALTGAYLILLARAVLASVDDVETGVLLRSEDACLDLLDALIEHLDAMFRLPRRKLVMLAVCALMGRYRSVESVRKRLPVAFNGVVQVLREEDKQARRPKRAAGDPDDLHAMFKKAGEDPSIGPDDPRDAVLPEETRRAQLNSRDIVETSSMRQACVDLLSGFTPEGAAPLAALSSVLDPALLNELEGLLGR